MNENNYIGLAIDELYRIFGILNNQFFYPTLDIPMITVQLSRRKSIAGWFSLKEVWINSVTGQAKYEINLCAEYLNAGKNEIVGTLLHEMVHYANMVDGIKDHSIQVHNKKFKERAEAVGLVVSRSKKYGYGHTECSEELINFISENVKPNSACFSYLELSISVDINKHKEINPVLTANNSNAA